MRHVTLLALALLAACATTAVAKTSHEGWPKINGVLKMNKQDKNKKTEGTRKNDEFSRCETISHKTIGH